MSSTLQTLIALGLVALALAFLLGSWMRKKPTSGCGRESCGAISPEIKKLRSGLPR
jgi:hypothetical protein